MIFRAKSTCHKSMARKYVRQNISDAKKSRLQRVTTISSKYKIKKIAIVQIFNSGKTRLEMNLSSKISKIFQPPVNLAHFSWP